MDQFGQFLLSEDTDFIPLITNEEDNKIPDNELAEEIAILPLRNTVLFPGVVSPITAGRDKSIQLIQDSQRAKKRFGVLAQKEMDIEHPNADDMFEAGTLVQMIKSFRMPDGNITAILQGKRRFRVLEWLGQDGPYLRAKVTYLNDDERQMNDVEYSALMEKIRELALEIIGESPNIPTEAQVAVKNIESDTFLVHFIASNMNLSVQAKQTIINTDDIGKRASLVFKNLVYEKQMMEVKNDITKKVQTEFDQQQREYFLHQQMRTIQEELGDNSGEAEIAALKERAEAMQWPESAAEQFEKSLKRLQRMNPQVPDHGIQRNYLELMLDLPWDHVSKDKLKLSRARRILQRDHFGMDKVKERVLEHLAVLKLKGDMKSPIICLHGPPGVGKTSLGKSIAESLGREYVRMSLGGLRDESEIRGHRKTYIGAMPGRILQLLKKAGTGNPVFVLDEIDKLSFGAQGDPSSALLEVLDPEQNSEFYDNFLEMGYDLSKVLFIATANNIGAVQPALRDRMELIEVSGYTVEEKMEIAKKHLLPKQLERHGLASKAIAMGKREMRFAIERYTRESGVRDLDRKMAQLVRKLALAKAEGKAFDATPDQAIVQELLGTPRFDAHMYQGNEVAGVVTGLAWTPVGGDILFIESNIAPGKGKVTITGNLGDVMKESARIAMAYIKANADKLGIDAKLFTSYDIHVHVPEGAIPKDGPSAGVTLLTALTSLFTQRKVKAKLAMSGEITLRGNVLPVGGLREKILAAKRSGINQILLCKDNRKDVDEIPPKYIKGIHIHYVSEMLEVIDFALLSSKVKDAKQLLA